MKRRMLAKILTAVMLISTLGNTSGYMAATAGETATDIAVENEHLNVYKDWDLDANLSFAGIEKSKYPRLKGNLPASYSSSSDVDWDFEQTKDVVTSVKNQNPYGTCWAFATISAAETSYIINENITDIDAIDFNEYHLVHYTYDTPENPLGLFGGDAIIGNTGESSLELGGNCVISSSVLANWIGVSDSEDFTVDDVGQMNSDALAFEDVAHLEDAYYIAMPDMQSASYQADMNIVKSMLMQYGSLNISYYSGYDAGDESSGYYYCPYSWDTNHAVTIVGWDDTVPAASFASYAGNTPAGNGAWLIKNSWGAEGELDGYFWISYYDASLDEEAYAYNVVGADNYDNNYQYDGAFCGSYMYNTDSICQANAFIADSFESLEAVGFYTFNTNIDYEIRIYKNLASNEAPQYGDLVLTQTGSEIYAGYHTIELTEAIGLEQGERYAVVITLEKMGEDVQLPVDDTTSWGWLRFVSQSNAGESYCGVSYDDLSDLKEIGNGCNNVKIKAFTNEAETSAINGQCGDRLYWSLSGTGVLTISGTGDMWSYENVTVPWYEYKNQIEKIVFTNGVTSIANGAFRQCENLTDVQFADTITSIGDFCFRYCTKLGNVDLPDGLKSLGQECFAYCDAMTELIIPDKVTFLGGGLAEMCKSLRYVYIGGSKTVGSYTAPDTLFSDCPMLERIEVSADNLGLKAVDGVLYSKNGSQLIQYPIGNKATTIRVLDGTKEICMNAFRSAKYLEQIIIPNGVTKLGACAFLDCTSLTRLVIPSSVTQIGPFLLGNNEKLLLVNNASAVTLTLPEDKDWMDGKGNAITSVTSGVAYELGSSITQITNISLNKTSATLQVGEKLQLSVAILPIDAFCQEIKWDSSDSSIIKVDSNGQVEAIAAGKAIVTATAVDGSGVSASCTITVQKPVQPAPVKIAYNIQFHGNGATSGTVSAQKNCLYNNTYVLSANTYQRKGYTFAGWNTRADGKGTAYADKASVRNLTSVNGSTVTLYAQWKPVAYKITYKLNSGKNNKSNPSSYYVTTSAIKLKNPTRKGYTFKGWYTDKKFKNKITQIAQGSTKNYTLYAKWSKVSVKGTTLSSAKKSKSKKIVLKYKKSSGAAGYEISYSTDKKFKKSVTKKTTKKLTYTISKLKKGKTYYVRVRAYKLDSAGKKVYGKYSKVIKVKVKK